MTHSHIPQDHDMNVYDRENLYLILAVILGFSQYCQLVEQPPHAQDKCCSTLQAHERFSKR
jgi:hypothetical protein